MTRFKVVDDDQTKQAVPDEAIGAAERQAAALAAELQPEPETPPAPILAPALPNPDVSHAQKLYVEDRARLTNYEQSLALLEDERANLIARFDAALADVEKRITDHQLCCAMTTGSISVYEEATEK